MGTFVSSLAAMDGSRSPRPVGKRGETRAAVDRMSAKDLDPRTIAQVLGISVSAVHYHLRQLRDDEGVA